MENWERKFILQDLGKDGPFPFSVAKKVKHSKGSLYQNGIPGEKKTFRQCTDFCSQY